MSCDDLISALMNRIIDFLPYVVGAEDYNAAAIHCLNCLANPKINRYKDAYKIVII
jgi:hypothetical protein